MLLINCKLFTEIVIVSFWIDQIAELMNLLKQMSQLVDRRQQPVLHFPSFCKRWVVNIGEPSLIYRLSYSYTFQWAYDLLFSKLAVLNQNQQCSISILTCLHNSYVHLGSNIDPFISTEEDVCTLAVEPIWRVSTLAFYN